MKKIFVLFVPLVFIFLGCHSKDKIYRKPIEKPVDLLNPKFFRQSMDYMIARNIYGQFLTYDSFGNVQPGIFQQWQVDDNGKVYRFVPNPKATFHDEKPVTVDDVIFSFNYLAAKDSLVSRYFSNIDGYENYILGTSSSLSGIRKIDNKTIEVKLQRCSFIFLLQLADPKIVILPANLRNMSEQEFYNKPIGAGAYKFKSLTNNNTKLTLERFEKYHGSKSNIKTYLLTTFDKSTAIHQFLAGQLEDLEAYELTPDELNDIKFKANLFSPSSSSVYLLFFNGRKQIFHDKEVRKRLANAIDIKEIATSTNRQLIPSTSVVPVGLLGWSEKKSNKTEEIHLSTTPLKKKCKIHILTYLVYKQNHLDDILNKIKDDIENKTDFTAVFDYRDSYSVARLNSNGNYDLLLDNIMVRGPEPFNIFTFFDSKSPHNLTFFQDDYLSGKFAEIEGMQSVQRSIGYSELSHYITDECYYAIPLFTEVLACAFSKAVKFKDNPTTFYRNVAFEKVQL